MHALIRRECTQARRAIKRLEKKREKQQREYDEAQKGPWYRRIADSLLAESPDAHPKTAQRPVYNIHTQQTEEVKLNPKFDGPQNAQLYYKRARKAERGAQIARRKLEESDARLTALRTALQRCTTLLSADTPADERDVPTLQQAWQQLHHTLAPHTGASAKKGTQASGGPATPAHPYRHYTIDGWDVYIGKNNTQNDELTTRFARPWHIWLHVVSHAGSHVVIARGKKDPAPPAAVLEKAGALAVWFSKAKHTSFAEVHVTEARFVRKPRKSPPGQVVAERCKTIRVSPRSPESLFPSTRY
jgi:predicted ribosome quality control (RQC) complex YloA/Tae2 family protein